MSGSSWAGGNGVDVLSNYPWDGSTTGNACGSSIWNLSPTSGPAQWGLQEECVEFAQRMYQTRGWTNFSGPFPGVQKAADIFPQASNLGMTSMAQGSITLASIEPGDMIISNEFTWGHVALVDHVTGNTVYIAEQNGGGSGTGSYSFSSGSLTRTGFTVTGVVHDPNDHLTNGGGSTLSTPSATARDSSDMDTFYNDNNGNLVDRYWNSTNGWNSTYWGLSPTSVPSAVARTSTNLDVFFRSSTNNLVDQYWSSSLGWNTVTLTSNGTMRGDPTVISRNSGSMEVFYRDSSGNLVDWYWSSVYGWNSAFWGDSLKGDPSAFYRDANDTDVFYRDTFNNLGVEAWNSVTGWSATGVVTNGTIGGDPGVVSPNSGDMDAFYQDGTTNKLYDRWWDSSLGWNTTSWSVLIAGKPSAFSRSSSNMDVFVRSNGNNLVDQYWTSAGGWNTYTADSNGDLKTDPSAIARTSNNMDVFEGTSTSLLDVYWDSVHGWNSTFWPW